MLDVRTFSLGDLGTNAYVISEEGKSECVVVDCGASPEALIRMIRQSRLSPSALVLTHGHFDHIAGVEEFRQVFPNAEVWIHVLEADFLTNPDKNLSGYWSQAVICQPADHLFHNEQDIVLGPWKFRVIPTPGHSPGSLVLFQGEQRLLFAGDLIFKDSVGRSDFPHSDPELLVTSLKNILMNLPEDTKIFPGHGPATTLGREKKLNPYLRELQ